MRPFQRVALFFPCFRCWLGEKYTMACRHQFMLLNVCFGLLTVASGRQLLQAPQAPAFPSGFIRAQGTKFVDSNCRDFAFVGANS